MNNDKDERFGYAVVDNSEEGKIHQDIQDGRYMIFSTEGEAEKVIKTLPGKMRQYCTIVKVDITNWYPLDWE